MSTKGNPNQNNISFEKLAETSPAAITEVDKDGRIVYANDRAQEVLGLEKSELIDRTYDDPDWRITDLEGNDYPSEELPFQIVKRTKKSVRDVRHAIEWPDGERKLLSINASPLFDENGNFDGMVAVIEDITERVSIRKELKQSKERYQKYFDKTGDAIFILKMGGENHGKILDVNSSAVDQTGYSREELVGMNMLEDLSLEPPPDFDLEEADSKLARGETVRFTEKKEKKDGTEYWTEVVVTPLEYEGKQANLSINRDITERKKLRRRQDLISHSLDQASIEIYWIKPDGSFVYTNEKVKQKLGYTAEEFNDMHVWDVDPNPEHSKDKREQRWKRLKEEGVLNFESTHRTEDGETYPVEIVSHYVNYEGSEYEFAFADDITERKEREEKLKRSEKRYRTVFETTGTAMIIIEEDTTISLANNQVEDLTGYSKDEIEGRMSWTELVARDEDLEKMKEYHKVRRKNPSAAPNQYEFKLADRDRNEKDALITIDMIPGTKKSVASLIDITDQKNAQAKLRQSFIELAETTSRVLGVRDPYTQEHEQRVGELAREVGKRMGLEEEELLGLYLGGVLHDIGKIAIPETIMTKPGKLNDIEWQMIKSHPKVGYNQILKDTDFPWPVAEMTLHHHERLDGSGYPDGLEGDELTKEVRILGAVDVVEAMSTRRPYREARTKERTLKVIKEGKGGKFDPEVVEVLVEMIEEGEIQFGGR